MKVVVQRVKKATCRSVNNYEVSINHGLMLLVSFTHSDTDAILQKMAKKIVNLRIFDDEMGKMNKALQDVDGEILSISQFTLYANPYEGNRPSFTDCMYHQVALAMYQKFNHYLNQLVNHPVKEGLFGEYMELSPICDGPVTINLEYTDNNGRLHE